MLNRRRETLSPLAEKYYTHILESASPSVSVTLPASSSVTSSADDTSSEASLPSSHSSVVSCQTPVQGRSPVELDSVCQTSTESSTETTVSRPVTHVTSPHEVMQRTSTSNVPSNTVPLVGAPSYREAITSHCSISASDLLGCPRLTGAPDQNVVEILDQYRIIVGLKAKSVRPGDEKFADNVALEQIVLIAEGTCVTLLQQLLQGMVDCSAPSSPSATERVANMFDPPTTWSQLKRALLDLLMPANAIHEAATNLLSLSRRPSETVLEFHICFRSAIARFESALERAGPNHPPLVALYVSHYESVVKPSLQCLQYTQKTCSVTEGSNGKNSSSRGCRNFR